MPRSPWDAASICSTLKERIGAEVMGRIFDAGFNLDLVMTTTPLRLAGKIEGDALVLGNGAETAIARSCCRTSSVFLDTLRMLDAFVRGGGTLIATRRLPAIAPGFRATDAEHAEVRDTIARLFNGPNARAKLVADEKEVGAALRQAILPDVEILTLPPATPTSALGFVHRRLPYADVYFIANTSNRPQTTAATFRVKRKHAAYWKPMTGETVEAVAEPAKDGSARITTTIRLEPYESRFLVFSDSAFPASSASQEIGAGGLGGESIDLATGWTVTFTPVAATFNGPTDAPRAAAQVAPAAAPLDRLRSWTEDEATRYPARRPTIRHAAGPVPAVPPARDAAVRRRDAGQPAHDGHHDAFRHGGAGAAACVDRSRCAKWRSSTSTASARARCGRRRMPSMSPRS